MKTRDDWRPTTEGVLTQEEIAMLSMHVPEPRSLILVVDDDEVFRKMLTKGLRENLPYAVEEAANGIEASIRIGAQPPDLLILDIMMPEMDGLELCKVIRKDPNLANLQVIIVTGFPGHDKVARLANMGFTDVFVKPFDILRLFRTVDRMLQRPYATSSDGKY
ncbi:MAG TPA: two-component system response regulator [Syntrophobacteraceae bacterium]|nr:two-component system response regulator [Syntrophobacteraceae bacterium]HBZ56602.1 two-component system response regulator [Syntrophobacteraceae bacterium]